MVHEILFALANLLAGAGWASLVLAPRWEPVRRGLPVAISFVLALAYTGLVAAGLPGADGGFGSLADVAQLMASPTVLLAGWVHYLAFDLFVGSWIAQDAWTLGIGRWVSGPILVLTFLLGPVGLASYLLVRLASKRKVGVDLGGGKPA